MSILRPATDFEPGTPASPVLGWLGKGLPPGELKTAKLRDVYGHGDELGRLFGGDSLDTLRWLLAQGYAGTVDLVYIDPPFGGGSLYSRKISMRGVDAGISFQVPAYQDLWSDAEYLQFMYERIVLLRELLSETGSFYLHVDTVQSHYLKVICDEVFGRENFQREIIWRIGWLSGYKTQAKNWIRNHDTILFYSKDPEQFFFAKQYAPYAPGYLRRGGTKPKGKGHPIEDTWNCSEQDRMDSIQIKSFSGEKTGYPTQKNESLLQRIISSSCPEGGLVLDCFSGSGTTASVASRMSRRWLAGDLNPAAIHTTRRRLLDDGMGQLSSGFSVWELEHEDLVQKRPKAEVSFQRTSNSVSVQIKDFQSPAVHAASKKRASDWHSLIDCVVIDFNYDGKCFRMDYADLPKERSETAKCLYNPTSSGRIALKIVDLLGNECLVAEEA